MRSTYARAHSDAYMIGTIRDGAATGARYAPADVATNDGEQTGRITSGHVSPLLTAVMHVSSVGEGNRKQDSQKKAP